MFFYPELFKFLEKEKFSFVHVSMSLSRQLTKRRVVVKLVSEFIPWPLVLKSTFIRVLCIRKVLCMCRAVSTGSVLFLYFFFLLL